MKNNTGFTLIELILYIGIVSVVMMAFIPFVLDMVQGGAKNSVIQEVSGNARLVGERLKLEIRNSSGINVGTSNFDTNLVSGGQISLVKVAPNNPTIIDVSGGRVRIKQGAGTAVELNSTDTEVTSLVFSNYSSGDNKTKNISFSFTIGNRYSGAKQTYKYEMSMRGAAEVRNN